MQVQGELPARPQVPGWSRATLTAPCTPSAAYAGQSGGREAPAGHWWVILDVTLYHQGPPGFAPANLQGAVRLALEDGPQSWHLDPDPSATVALGSPLSAPERRFAPGDAVRVTAAFAVPRGKTGLWWSVEHAVGAVPYKQTAGNVRGEIGDLPK